MITTGKELVEYVVDEYYKNTVELNSMFFDVEVEMKECEILSAYAEIQRVVNGDSVVRLTDICLAGDRVLSGNVEDNLIPDGEYQGIYKGNCCDFLMQFNGHEKDTGLCRYCDGEKLDFIY